VTEIGQSVAEYPVAIPERPDAVLVLAWGAATDTGNRRSHNEDSFLARSPIFAVADGMGGHSAGDVASAAVVDRLSQGITGDFTDVDTIERGLRAATDDIALALDEKELGVGTTVTGAALSLLDGEPSWTVFNVGDSRVYLFEHNELVQVTIDHSVVQELVDAGVIRAEDAESHPDSNVITRAVGFNMDAIPDYWVVPVRRGLRLLICSDGLTKEVDREGLRLHLAAARSAQETALDLVGAALAAGGRDNITAIVVDVVDSTGIGETDNTIPRTGPTPTMRG
jgi:serine/threonine protein phosphatase PrpC